MPKPRLSSPSAPWLRTTLTGSVLWVLGCVHSTLPGDPVNQGGVPSGSVDPVAPSFVLDEIAVVGQETVRLDLVGSNLRIDPEARTVTLDVAVRNSSDRALDAPARVDLLQVVPPTVFVANPDIQYPCLADRLPGDCPAGFDYSAHLGDDGVLSPGEVSAAKSWVFSDPGLVSYSFEAVARFGFEPMAYIAGTIFADSNRNGSFDPGEGPFRGRIEVGAPDGTVQWAWPAADGSYRAIVEQTGLFRLRWHDSIFCRCPWWAPACCTVCVTTANPLQVVLVPGADGRPQSFTGADFGVADGPCHPETAAVVLTDSVPAAVPQDPYTLLEARLDGDIFNLRVGISGCSPDHPLVLLAGRSFAESKSVQTWMLLAHDDRDEPCDAWFERTLRFDLDPIRQAHILDYGGPGIVRLRFRDAQGDEHSFDFGP